MVAGQDVSQSLLLTIYCLLIAAAALAGGWLPILLRMTHTGMQLAMSFVGGTMLGVGLLHLLPHAYFELEDIYPCVWWLLAGFLAMFFIERVFHFHHHDAPAEDAHEHGHGHAHHGDHAAGHSAAGATAGSQGWKAALVGLALHSGTDGMALAAAVAAEPAAGSEWFSPSGLGVFLVVFLHKPFDSLTLGTLMAVSGESARDRHVVNLLYSVAAPLGAILFFLGASEAHASQPQVLGAALAFSAGTFLCISTSDLLPELQFHAHDRLKLSAALVLGLALAAGIVSLDAQVHHHDVHHEHSPSEDDGRTP
jgi:zinc and cadmium transporter